MAVVTEVVIVVKGDDKQLDSTLTKLEKMGAIDKKNAAQFEKTQKEFQSALKKRNTRIDQLQQRLGKLAIAQGKAFDPKRIERINKIIKQTQKEVETLGGKFEKQAKKTNQSLSKTDNLLQKIGSRIIAAFAIERIASFTSEAVTMAAQLEGVKFAFDRLNTPGLLDNLRKATKGTVADLELMKQAVQAKNLGVPIQKLGTFFEFARRRAKETGESVEFLTNSIVLGIGRKSPLILDNLGISAVALRDKIKEVGDFGQAAGIIIEQSLADMGEDIDTTSERIAQMNTSWQNTKVIVGQSLTPVVNKFLDEASSGLSKLNTGFENFSDTLRTLQGLLELGGLGGLADAVDPIRIFTIDVDNLANVSLQDLTDALDQTNRESIRLIAKHGENSDEVKVLKVRYDELNDALTTKFFEGMTIAQNNNNEATSKNIKLTEKQINALKKLREEQKKFIAENIVADEEDFTPFGEDLVDVDGLEEDFLKIGDIDQDFVDESEKRHQRLNDALLESNANRIDQQLEDEQEAAKKEEKRLEENVRRRIEIAEMSVDFISNLNAISTNKELQRILTEEEAIKTALDSELKNEKLTQEQKVTLREDADEELKKLKLERAEADKKQAKFNVILNTAQGIVAALASVPPNIPLSIAIAAIGASELAVINSEPIPQFAKGTKKVKGGKKGKDSVLAWLMPDEGVIPADKNTQYSGPVGSIIDGTFHKNYMHKDEVMEIENSFAQNVANSLHFNDENMLFAMQQGRRQDKKLMNGLANVLTDAINKSNQRRFKY